ncbi:unnamed protein product [Amoebophrya sp. A120]|nr:unnamed protein product [Amoebophrya sp. A120]|eukprot:GSA120T00005441001.1
MFNDFSPGETQHGRHDGAALEDAPRRGSKQKMGASENVTGRQDAPADPAVAGGKKKGKDPSKMSSKERVRQALNTKADSTTIIIGRNYITEADAVLPYGTKKVQSRVTPKYPQLGAKEKTILDPAKGVQPGLKAADQPGAPTSVENLIAQGRHMDKPVQPFYELAPAEQSKIRLNTTIYRIFMCIGVSFAAGCCGGVWYYLKFKGAGDEEEDPFEPYEDLIEEQEDEVVATTTTTTTTLFAPTICVGKYCFSSLSCEQFDTNILQQVSDHLTQSYYPLVTTINSMTDCVNATIYGVPDQAEAAVCGNPAFGCNAIQLIPAKLFPFLMGQAAKARDIPCGCELCKWPLSYITSEQGVQFCGESNARAYVEGDPCGSVCGLTWPEMTTGNITDTSTTTTTTTSTTSTTTTIDTTICIGPDYRPNDNHCPECTTYHSRIVGAMANSLQATSSDLVNCVKRTYEGLPQLATLGFGRSCSSQRLCFAFEVMVFEFAKSADPLRGMVSNEKCACELCKWPRDWLSYGPGRNCLNAQNIVEGKWCGPYCNGTYPITYTGDTSTWTGLTPVEVSSYNPATDGANGTNGTNGTNSTLRVLSEGDGLQIGNDHHDAHEDEGSTIEGQASSSSSRRPRDGLTYNVEQKKITGDSPSSSSTSNGVEGDAASRDVTNQNSWLSNAWKRFARWMSPGVFLATPTSQHPRGVIEPLTAGTTGVVIKLLPVGSTKDHVEQKSRIPIGELEVVRLSPSDPNFDGPPDQASEHSPDTTSNALVVPPQGFLLDSTSGLFAADVDEHRHSDASAMCHLVAHEVGGYGSSSPWSNPLRPTAQDAESPSSPSPKSSSEALDTTWSEIGERQAKLHGLRSVFTRRVRVEYEKKTGTEQLLVDYAGQWSESPTSAGRDKAGAGASSATPAGGRGVVSSSSTPTAEKTIAARSSKLSSLPAVFSSQGESRDKNLDRLSIGADSRSLGLGSDAQKSAVDHKTSTSRPSVDEKLDQQKNPPQKTGSFHYTFSQDGEFGVEATAQNGNDETDDVNIYWWEGPGEMKEIPVSSQEVLESMKGLWKQNNPRAVFSLATLVQRLRAIQERKRDEALEQKRIKELLATVSTSKSDRAEQHQQPQDSSVATVLSATSTVAPGAPPPDSKESAKNLAAPRVPAQSRRPQNPRERVPSDNKVDRTRRIRKEATPPPPGRTNRVPEPSPSSLSTGSSGMQPGFATNSFENWKNRGR